MVFDKIYNEYFGQFFQVWLLSELQIYWPEILDQLVYH
jgi:hypothetical protein